jgi:hypothetical protein
MTSYTAMARERAPALGIPPNATMSDVVDHWFDQLPAARKRQVTADLMRAVRRLPEDTRLKILRVLRRQNEHLPEPLGVEHLDGLGCVPCYAALLGCACQERGLGWVGALTTSIAQIGTGVWTTMEQKDLQKDLAKMSTSSQQEIARIQAEAAVEAQRILATAQIETARQAKEGMVGVAQSGAPLYKNLAIGGVAVVALGAGFLLLRKRKAR